ncbi:unnamed protein product [Moneuplotes crassus]|uniref:Uncharacterized protein n=1 Tax=Euplotes crassus TaxID=5936 RepID=A0AAD2D6C7_EUPCR|nr:unnamed protein product [Moneuplotes crassus]
MGNCCETNHSRFGNSKLDKFEHPLGSRKNFDHSKNSNYKNYTGNQLEDQNCLGVTKNDTKLSNTKNTAENETKETKEDILDTCVEVNSCHIKSSYIKNTHRSEQRGPSHVSSKSQCIGISIPPVKASSSERNEKETICKSEPQTKLFRIKSKGRSMRNENPFGFTPYDNGNLSGNYNFSEGLRVSEVIKEDNKSENLTKV